jgi:DNA-binding HxlR family transcriptional regulator
MDVTVPPSENVQHVTEHCREVSRILALVGDKWTVLVVMLLGDGPRRFNDIKRSVDGISQRMLTHTLRLLERDGMVRRTVTPIIPPRVDYELTDLGRSLLDPVRGLGEWALGNLETIKAASAAFDARNAGQTSSLGGIAPALS